MFMILIFLSTVSHVLVCLPPSALPDQFIDPTAAIAEEFFFLKERKIRMRIQLSVCYCLQGGIKLKVISYLQYLHIQSG